MVMKVDIYQSKPHEATIKVDGVNVADSVQGVRVNLGYDHLPQVELDLVVVDVSLDLDHSQVFIPPSARHLLIEMGWTPPAPPYRVDLVKHTIKGGPLPWD
jgi:hypothetical protein